jgi:membrane protein
MIQNIKQLIIFFNKGIWEIDNEQLSNFKKQLYTQIRIVILSVRGYLKHDGNLSASALTFFTMLSIVPVLAMAFGIAKGFGIDGILEEQIRKNLYGQDEVVEKLIDFSRSMLESTNGGIVAGIGFVIVFYSVLKLLNSIEETFNKAWEIKDSRTFYRKFTDYTSFVVIAPVLFTISSSISVFVISRVESATQSINAFGVVDGAITLALEVLSFTLIWLLMLMIYMLLPNAKVSWRAGLQSGIVIGTLFIITQWLYVNFQVGVARANAIYGSFAALPLFLVWLQTSWFIIIFGAEYSHAVQFESTYREKVSIGKLSEYSLKKITLLITHIIIKDFADAKPPTKANSLLEKLALPRNLLDKILTSLLDAGIITEVMNKEERCFQPAMDIKLISISKVLIALEDLDYDEWKFNNSEASKKIEEVLKKFREITAQTGSNQLLVNI